MRKSLQMVIPYSNRFKFLLYLGSWVRFLLPSQLRSKLPRSQPDTVWPVGTAQRQMLVLQGCVQLATNPNINTATARVLQRLDISLITAPAAGCCGAMSLHLGNDDEARGFARKNIDAWWPYIEQGVEAIVMTASGCGVSVKEYADWLENDPNYKHKAQKVVALVQDISEVLSTENPITMKFRSHTNQRVAFHNPCTLQHGQKINGTIERILENAGYKPVAVNNTHLCCGSAGTYSILQSKLSQQLLQDKIVALQSEDPDIIATANIGCLLHIQSASKIPVKHWIELLDKAE